MQKQTRSISDVCIRFIDTVILIHTNRNYRLSYIMHAFYAYRYRDK